jgi:hypothetical protein
VTGSQDEAGLAIMAALAAKHLREPYSLSAIPLIFEDGEWQDWIPPKGHPLDRTFKQMHIDGIGPLYSEQKKLLDAVHVGSSRPWYHFSSHLSSGLLSMVCS